MYVVVEGNRFSSGLLGMPPTLNFQDEPVCIGTVELDGNLDLELALTLDGVNEIEDLFDAGNPTTPYEQVLFGSLDPTQVKLIGAFNPADDVDGDGIQDLGDNCPWAANPEQTNSGSFLDATPGSDFLGDACQCGDGNDDGAVFADDVTRIREHLVGLNPSAIVEAKCSVAGTVECNIRDPVFLKEAIDGLEPSVAIRCDAALSPPNAP